MNNSTKKKANHNCELFKNMPRVRGNNCKAFLAISAGGMSLERSLGETKDRRRFQPIARGTREPIALQGGRALTCCLWAWISWQSRADCLLSKWNSSSAIPTALPWASVSVRKPRKFSPVAEIVSCVTQVELRQTFVVPPPHCLPLSHQGFFCTRGCCAR